MFSLSFMCLMLGNMHSPSVKTLQNKQHKTNNELQEKFKNDKKWKTKNSSYKSKIKNKRKKKPQFFLKNLVNWKWLSCFLCSTSYTKRGKSTKQGQQAWKSNMQTSREPCRLWNKHNQVRYLKRWQWWKHVGIGSDGKSKGSMQQS
jgi:hypothetical protein